MNMLIGAVLGFVRDQGQPWYIPEGQLKPRFPWKKVALGVFGLWHGLLAWLAVPWWGATLVGAAAAGAWSQGHRQGLDMEDDRDWHAMGLTGVVASLGVGLAWAVGANPVTGVVVAASGALKPVCYWLAYKVRGRNTPWPHATAFGAVAHGATMGLALDVAVLAWLLG